MCFPRSCVQEKTKPLPPPSASATLLSCARLCHVQLAKPRLHFAEQQSDICRLQTKHGTAHRQLVRAERDGDFIPPPLRLCHGLELGRGTPGLDSLRSSLIPASPSFSAATRPSWRDADASEVASCRGQLGLLLCEDLLCVLTWADHN